MENDTDISDEVPTAPDPLTLEDITARRLWVSTVEIP